MLRLFLILLAASLLSVPPAFGADDPPIREDGRFFTIVGRGLSQATVRDAVATADAAWPHIREVYGAVPKGGWDDRMVIHIHRTVTGYEQAEYALTRGRFKDNLAFSSWETWESHIALQPFMSDEALEVTGLPGLTRQQIAHEATHIASYKALEIHKQLPTWFSEGAACYVARRTMIDLGFATPEASDPESAKDILRVREMIESGNAPSMEDYLNGAEIRGARLEQYSFWTVAFEFLMSPGTGSAFRSGLRKLTKLKGSSKASDVNGVFRKALTKRRIAGLDKALRSFLESRDPKWDLKFRALDVLEDRWVQGTLHKNAIAWQLVSLPSTYRVTGKFTVLPGEKQQLNLLLARHGHDMIQICLAAGDQGKDGGVTVFDYRSNLPDKERYRRMGYQSCSSIQIGREVAFVAEVGDQELVIRIADEEVLRVPRNGLDLTGAFGVGALRGSAGIWREVTATASK